MVLVIIQMILAMMMSTGQTLTASQESKIQRAIETDDATEILIVLDEIYD